MPGTIHMPAVVCYSFSHSWRILILQHSMLPASSRPLHGPHLQRPSRLRTGCCLLHAAAPDALGLGMCLSLVATQQPLLGPRAIYHCQGELSACLFPPVEIRLLESDSLFLLLVSCRQVRDWAPRSWSENVCGVAEPCQPRDQEASGRRAESP